MLRLGFVYNAAIYSTLALVGLWLTHTNSFGIAIIGSLALLYIVVFPLGSALMPERALRQKALPVIGILWLIFFVCQMVLTVAVRSMNFIYWLVLLVVYCGTLFAFWRLDQRPHRNA